MNKQEIEIAIDELKQQLNNSEDCLINGSTCELAIQALEQQLHNGWIPVSERLPTKEEYLQDDGRFIVTDGNRRYQGWFDVYEGHFAKEGRDDVWQEDKCVLAWQPLPPKYTEVTNEN